VSPAKALRTIAGAATAGRVVFSVHAQTESMPDDGVSIDDVLHVLIAATGIHAEDDTGAKWKVYGPVVSGAAYAVVVRIRGDRVIVIVTCHLPP
jgi:hypothetical protein